MKRKGYMMVRYTAIIPDGYSGGELEASGARFHISSKHSELMDKLKAYYNYSLADDNITLISKDLRSGWFIVNSHNKEKIMLAVMPYSGKRIESILI